MQRADGRLHSQDPALAQVDFITEVCGRIDVVKDAAVWVMLGILLLAAILGAAAPFIRLFYGI